MVQTIDTPEGPIDFPDGMPVEQIQSALQAHFAKPAQPELTATDKAIGGLRSVAQGSTFGFADELERLAAGLGGGVAGAVSGVNPMTTAMQTYQDYGPQLAQERQQFAQKMPIANVVGELTGGFAGPSVLKAAEYIKAGASPLRQIGRAAGVGAIQGGAYGAGTAEDSDRTAGALSGSIGGALLGGGLAGVGNVVSPMLGATAKRLERALGGSATMPATAAQRKLLERITQDQLDIPAIKRMLADAGEGATIADVGGKNVRGLAQALASMPGQASELAAQNLGATRSAGMGQRLIDAARSGLGVSGKVYDIDEQLLAEARAKAAPLYQEAFAPKSDLANKNFAQWDERLQRFIDEPYVRQGMAKGITTQRIEAVAENAPFNYKEFAVKGLDDAGNIIIDGTPNLRSLDAAKRGLDEIIEGYRDPVTRKINLDERGRAIESLRKSLVSKLDEMSTDETGRSVYKEARQAWAGPARSRSLMMDGRNFMRGDAEQLTRRLSNLSPQDMQFYRQGVMREIQGMVEGGKEGLSSVRTRLSTPAAKAKLAEVFPENGLNSFLKALDAETMKREAANKILGGSQTAERLANQLDTAVDPSGVLANLLQGNVKGAAVRAATDYAQKVVSGVTRMPEASRNELGQMLFSNNPAEQAKALNALQINVQSKADLQKLVGQIRNVWSALVVPQASGMLSGGLLTDNQ